MENLELIDEIVINTKDLLCWIENELKNERIEMIFIPGNVPSLKNSKTMTTIGKGKDKRNILLPSKTVKQYLQNLGIKKYSGKEVFGYSTRPNFFKMGVGNYFDNIEYPSVIGFHFVRDSKRKFDFQNAVHIVADLLVAHGYIEDDNMDFFIPFPMIVDGSWYSVDKGMPGVYLKIMGL